MSDAHVTPLGLAGGIATLRSRVTGVDDFARQLPAEWIDRLAAAGTPEDCAAAISALYHAGADSIVLVPMIDQAAGQTRLAAEQMLPILR